MMKQQHAFAAVAAVTAVAAVLFVGGTIADTIAQSEELVTIPHTFVDGTPAVADEVNENFEAVADGVNTLDSRQRRLGERVTGLEESVEDIEDQLATIPSITPVANTITVAKSGGGFSSVAAAVASITDNSEDNPYVVLVSPGVYDETDLIRVRSFVHVKGMGELATVIRANRTDFSVGGDAAVIRMDDMAALSDLTVVNDGTEAIAIGIIAGAVSRETVIDQVTSVVAGAGGTGHIAAHLTDCNATIQRSTFRASGASVGNTALASVDSGGAFAQPDIADCVFEGKGADNGFGLQLSETAATVRNSQVHGDQTGISSTVAGVSRVSGGKVSTLALSPVYESTGSAALISMFVELVGGNPTGPDGSFKYAHCVKANGDPVVDGTDSSIEP